MCQSISSYRSLFFCALLSTCIGAADFVLAAFHLCAPPLPGAIPLPPRTPPLKKRPLPYIGRNVLEVSTLMNKNITVESILPTHGPRRIPCLLSKANMRGHSDLPVGRSSHLLRGNRHIEFLQHQSVHYICSYGGDLGKYFQSNLIS